MPPVDEYELHVSTLVIHFPFKSTSFDVEQVDVCIQVHNKPKKELLKVDSMRQR